MLGNSAVCWNFTSPSYFNDYASSQQGRKMCFTRENVFLECKTTRRKSDTSNGIINNYNLFVVVLVQFRRKLNTV